MSQRDNELFAAFDSLTLAAAALKKVREKVNIMHGSPLAAVRAYADDFDRILTPPVVLLTLRSDPSASPKPSELCQD